MENIAFFTPISHHYCKKTIFLDSIDHFVQLLGDIIVTTAYKTGTTWTQNILITLMFQGQTLPPEAGKRDMLNNFIFL